MAYPRLLGQASSKVASVSSLDHKRLPSVLLYLVPFSSYLTLRYIITLKCELQAMEGNWK